MSTFDTHGPVAKEQLDIMMITLWVSVFIFVCVGSLMIIAVFKFHHKGEITPDTPLPPQTHGNTMLEITLTVISIGLLAIIAIPTLVSIFHLSDTPSDKDVLHVTVQGYQWWWGFVYEDALTKKVTTANELRIPIGRTVELHLESKDIIHSFWVPQLAGKVDVIPNQHNVMWLRADERGEYWGQCAEYCGTSHANMRFRVIAMYPEEFNLWVKAQSKPAATPPPNSLAAEGESIFMKGPQNGQACATCHTITTPDGMAMGLIGPNLTHFASRSTMAAGILDLDDQDIRKWLHNPGDVKPGNHMATQAMPPLQLTPDEINALAAYLETLK